MRTQNLIDAKCDKFALKLIERIIYAIRRCTNCHPLRKTLSIMQHQYLLQAYFSLLFKFKRIDHLKNELNAIDLESALKFIEYTYFKCDHFQASQSQWKNIIDAELKITNRLHKFTQHMKQFSLQFFLIKFLRNNVEHNVNYDRIIQIMIKIWLIAHHDSEDFNIMFTKLVENTSTNMLTYLCCDTLYKTVSLLTICININI